MSYLEQITIGIPVRIDSWERKRNLLALLHYISSSGMRVHVWDAGSEECQFPDDICSKITYTYERDENLVYHKTRYVNLLLREISTPIVAIWDADIIFSLSQLEVSIQAIIERKYVMSIPYNGVVKMLSKKQSEAYILSGQRYDHLVSHDDMYARLMWRPSCGGVFVVDREKYLRSGGDNERFISWGPEDAERIRRMEILGESVHWTNGGPLYHLWHPRGENSRYSIEKLAFINRMEFIKVCSMGQNELHAYVKSW